MATVFETIKNRLPITEVLSSYITLTQSGSQWKARCPFHNERTPSFSVSPEKGFYYCFGCGATGDIFTFVERFEGLDARGALKVLADRAGVSLVDTVGTQESTDPLYAILEKTALQYQEILSASSPALQYLAMRGVTKETIDSFRIGYAPDEWRTVTQSQKDTTALSYAERAGLVKKVEDGRVYDRFRKRIMFPLCDASGRVIGFSGRIFPESGQDEGPKYLNSPETELFQKSRILFGFDKAKQHIKKNNFAILVEGQFDLIMSHQAGFRNTVATSGTAVSMTSAEDTTSHLSVIARMTPNIFLAFDGDSAGQKALERAALVALSVGMNPRVVPLPEGKDPAEYILEQGADAWKALLKKSEHFLMHESKRIVGQGYSAHTLVVSVRERLFPFLKAIPSPIERDIHIERIAEILSLASVVVRDEFALFAKGAPAKVSVDVAKQKSEDSVSIHERFVALVESMQDPVAAAALESVSACTFYEHTLSLPVLVKDRRLALEFLVAEEYGKLTPGERQQVVTELGAKIRDQFYLQLIAQYTRVLNETEGVADDAVVTHTLTRLQELNRLRMDSTDLVNAKS